MGSCSSMLRAKFFCIRGIAYHQIEKGEIGAHGIPQIFLFGGYHIEPFDLKRTGSLINANFHLDQSFSPIRNRIVLPDRYKENAVEGDTKHHHAHRMQAKEQMA